MRTDGNETTFTRTVIVTEAPVITGEATTKVNPNSLFDVMSSMEATDKEDGDLTKNITVESNNVDTSKPGSYKVTYKVIDADGNETTFTRTVIVTEAPVITGGATTKVNPNSLFDVMSSMEATDKEDGDLTKNITVESNNVDTKIPGNYEVTYKVIDSDGNEATFTRTVVVTEVPVIAGEATTKVNPNSLFDAMSSMKATDKEDGDITKNITVESNNVDTKTPGNYEVTYKVIDSDGNEATFTRTIIVTEAPVITGEATTKVNPNSLFDVMSSIAATDKEDGDLTKNITVESNNVDTSKPGSYKVTYKVIDADGNEATFTRTVIVTEAPVITGEDKTQVQQGAAFDPMEAIQATDAEDGDITGLVQIIKNNVDMNKAGAYEIVYTVTDSDGNTTTYTRTIEVLAAPVLAPENPTTPSAPTKPNVETPAKPTTPSAPTKPNVETPAKPATPSAPTKPSVEIPAKPATPSVPAQPTTEKPVKITPATSDVHELPKTGDTETTTATLFGVLLSAMAAGFLALGKKKSKKIMRKA
ncbi:immunoglobulin-like domain-containing protein [Listeria rustica]|nr:immunoglobulin-like domain-containing protein [Listeria rustica]